MFDQTFVDGTERTKKPLTLFVSTLVQILVLCVLLLIPLVYTATLPSVAWKNLLMAPPPPLAKPLPNFVKAQTERSVRVLTDRVIVAPVAIPRQVNPVNDAGTPPDVEAPGVSSQPYGTAGSLSSAFEYPIPEAPPPAPKLTPKPAAGPIRVGGGVAEANLIRKVMPAYPALAKSARIQGTVEFRAVISKEGNIENLQLIHGHPLLVNAARDAVLQWKYRPTLLNGQPVEVLTDIVVNFTLVQ